MREAGFTADEIQQWRERGFVKVDIGLSEREIEALVGRYKAISGGETTPASITTVKNVASETRAQFPLEKIERLNADPTFRELHIERPQLLRKVMGITCPPASGKMITVSTKFLVKPPGSLLHPAHSDWAYFYLDPTSSLDKVVGTWIALEDADEENGTLFMVPGSHLDSQKSTNGLLFDHVDSFQEDSHGIQRAGYRVIDPAVLDEYRRRGKFETVTAKKGECILFHPLVIHGAWPNKTTDRTRMVLTAHFFSGDVQILTETQMVGSVHEALAEDLWRVFEHKTRRRGKAVPAKSLVKTMKLDVLSPDAVPNALGPQARL